MLYQYDYLQRNIQKVYNVLKLRASTFIVCKQEQVHTYIHTQIDR